MAAMLKPIRTVVTAALLTVATFAVAQEMTGGHPDTYVVKRGDTLWDIAGKFLKRPWLWPEIWQANPQIRNPHLIYPGDVISLAYLNRVAVEPGPREEAPITGIPLKDVEAFLKNLRVVDEFADLPYVVGLEDERLRSTTGQVAYVKGLADAQAGQRYAIVRPMMRYTSGDPSRRDLAGRRPADLDFRGRDIKGLEQMWSHFLPTKKGEFLGYELMQVTTGTISRGPSGLATEVATIVLDANGREVRDGDRLIAVEAQPYDLQFFPHPPKQQMEYGKARILAVADMVTSGGPRDVVALSVGARDGIDNGTVFSTWRVGSNAVDRVVSGVDRSPEVATKVRLPDEFAGHVMVFRTFDKVSYALVMDGIKPSRIGYELKHPDAAY